MASVALRFTPTTDLDDLAALHIYESATEQGPYAEIEVVTEIGVSPNYINEYTTNQATAESYWFAIQWEDSKGAITPLSVPIFGGDETLVSEIVSRVRLRMPSASYLLTSQEAEFVISDIMRKDPYDVTLSPTYKQLEGMTLLTQARVEISTMLANQVSGADFTVGLVSMKSNSKTDTQISTIDYLMKEAMRLLGLRTGIVAQMAPIAIAGGFAVRCSLDQSRLLLTEID